MGQQRRPHRSHNTGQEGWDNRTDREPRQVPGAQGNAANQKKASGGSGRNNGHNNRNQEAKGQGDRNNRPNNGRTNPQNNQNAGRNGQKSQAAPKQNPADKEPPITKFLLGTKELDDKTAEFEYDKGWYSITDIVGEERNTFYRSRNATEAYTKWNVYIGRKKERMSRKEREEAKEANN